MRFCAYLLAGLFVFVTTPVSAQTGDTETCRIGSNPEIAIEACNRVINSGQSSRRDIARAYVDRGHKHYVLKNYDAAIRDATAAIELRNVLAPDDLAIAYSNRGNGYFVKDDPYRAIPDYTTAINTNPAYAAPYTARGLLRERKGEIEAALADFRQALRTPRGDFGDDGWARETAQRKIDALEKR
jgi:tetratricopeptide (TPR) repeat protein